MTTWLNHKFVFIMHRFENYGKQGQLCGSDGLPHLIVSGDWRHGGEFITPGILFLYISGWIGRSWLPSGMTRNRLRTRLSSTFHWPKSLSGEASSGQWLPMESTWMGNSFQVIISCYIYIVLLKIDYKQNLWTFVSGTWSILHYTCKICLVCRIR